MLDWVEWGRVVLVVGVAVTGLVIWMSRWFGKQDAWTKGIEKEIAEFKEDTKKALTEIREDIKKILRELPQHVIAGTSPLRLTDLGEEVSNCVGASAWTEQLAPGLVESVKGKSAYEVQEFCIDYMHACELSRAQDQSFKKCAYEHGIKLNQVLDVCAVELRDKLLYLLGPEDTG